MTLMLLQGGSLVLLSSISFACAEVKEHGEGLQYEYVRACVYVCVCTESSRHPKLLGTALTLLGGQSLWYLDQPDSLRSVLDALSVTLKTGNEKLARNAATTVYRLCQQPALVGVILREHQQWVEGMLQVYGMLGGVQRRIGERTYTHTHTHTHAHAHEYTRMYQPTLIPFFAHFLPRHACVCVCVCLCVCVCVCRLR